MLSFTNSGRKRPASQFSDAYSGQAERNIERFFGGSPRPGDGQAGDPVPRRRGAATHARFSPFDILESIRELVARIYDLGFTAAEKAGRCFLLGAVIVFPASFIARLLKFWRRAARRPDDVIRTTASVLMPASCSSCATGVPLVASR